MYLLEHPNLLLPHTIGRLRWKKKGFFFFVVSEGDFGIVGFEMVLAHL